MYFKVVASAQPLHHVGAHHSLAIRMAPSTDHGQCALGHIRRGMFCLSARQSVLRSVCDRSWWGGWKFVSACVTTLSEQPSSRVCLASLGIARLAGMACCGRSRAVANASTSPSANPSARPSTGATAANRLFVATVQSVIKSSSIDRISAAHARRKAQSHIMAESKHGDAHHGGVAAQAATSSLYLIQLRPARADMLTSGPTADEATAIQSHFERLQRLAAEGVVALAGRTQTSNSDTLGLVIVRAASLEAATDLAREDPAVSSGVFTARTSPYSAAVLNTKVFEDPAALAADVAKPAACAAPAAAANGVDGDAGTP